MKVTDTPLFTFAAPPAQLAGQAEVVKRAFALKPGELGGPVETSRGIYILKIKDRKPSAVPPLAQIRTQVEQGALEDKSRELAKQKAEQSLAEMVKASPGLKLQDTGSFGYSAKGDVPKIGASPEIMEAAFSLTTAAPVAKKTFQVGDRWYVIKLKNRTEINKDAFAPGKGPDQADPAAQKTAGSTRIMAKEPEGQGEDRGKPGNFGRLINVR